MIVRAISIRQPFVELIVLGEKIKQHRCRPNTISQRAFLYASRTQDSRPASWQRAGKRPRKVPTGAVAGTVEIENCRWDEREECYAYFRRNRTRQFTPLFTKNQLHPAFWRPQL